MRDLVIEAVQTARQAAVPPPSNEQETCFRIIDPLLKSMGYGVQDIRIQDRDNAGQKPDYTILPDGGESTWFIEAKAWAVSLQDHHAQQAVNYANTQGKRWVVLTNGREWRLYDNQSFGAIDVKLACVATLEAEDIVGLLDALSRPSIEKRNLEDFARNARLYNCLSSQITRMDSEVTRAVVRALRSMHGMSRVTAEEVVRFWRDYTSGPPPTWQTLTPVAADEVQTPLPHPQATASPEAIPLSSLDASQTTGKKVRSVVLPTGEAIGITKWYELTVQAAVLALTNGYEPSSPLYWSARAKAPLLSKPEWETQLKMREPLRLPPPFADWMIERHFSALHHLGAAAKILRAAGIDPASVKVSVDERNPAK